MRKRRVGLQALPARLVAGAAGVLVLATAAAPVHAQEETGGGEVVCNLHGNPDPAGIVASDDGDGWWIVSSGERQDATLSVDRVGEDCNVRPADEAFVDHDPLDPQSLVFDGENGRYLWVGDTGSASERDWLTLNQIDLDDYANSAVWRYVFPGETREVETFLLLPGKTPLFITADEGEAALFSPSGDNQEYDTPLEEVGTVALPDGGAVTGSAFSPDGTKVALRTAGNVYEWTVADDIAATFAAEPVTTTPIADAGSPEDLAYDADGNFITLAATDGEDGTYGTVTRYTPVAAAAPDETASEDAGAAAESEGPSLVDRIIDLGFGTIIKILAAIAILGMIVMIVGIVVIRKHRKANADDADDELGFAAEESGFGGRRDDDEPFLGDEDDPVDLGLDSGHPDPDLGQVARGNVYGGAPRQEAPRREPAGNVYGGARPEPAGNVYGARPEPARPEPAGAVYGGGPRREPPAQAREEPQYGAFEGGGHGSVYDNAGPGQSFAARPEPSGNVYGNGGGRQEAPGNVYGGRQNGPQDAERAPDADDGYWGPPDGGTTYGRNR